MMLRNRLTLFAAALLLCAVTALCSGDVKNTTCLPGPEVECFRPADHLNASGPISIQLSTCKKLIISLEGLPVPHVCHWKNIRNNLELKINGSLSTVISHLFEADSGNYSLTWGDGFSQIVDLHVVSGHPTKPLLLLDNFEDEDISPNFKCISDGNPKPVIEWSQDKDHPTGTAENSVSSADLYNNGVMCCASNSKGQECTQLYDYDLETDSMKLDEVSNLTISPGEPLLLRCRTHTTENYWEFDGKKICTKPRTLPEMACRRDKLYSSRMSYVLIKSVNVEHSGTYTCRSEKDQMKSVHVNVTTENFLSVQLENQIVMKKDGNLMADVSYYPVLQHCCWEDPDKQTHKCWREQRVTKHRQVKLHGPLKSGVYKLHLESGGKRLTRNTTVCVADKPSFKFGNENENFTCETVTPLPANFTWMSCNTSDEKKSSCKVIKEDYQPGSDDFCNKAVTSFVDKKIGRSLMFCVTNALGSWCKKPNIIYDGTIIQHSKGNAASDNNMMLVLKVGSLLLILAVGVLMVVLMYYVKKKKPQYQPQLQMIQMVGPNDNDYIYINFKDFEYDKKWEFPRENLELGNELGSGAFGMVVQATAYGINKPGVSQQVAVKMLKEKHQTVEEEALMSELKMLTHIGHHPNIVNLLGACTEKGPIYLIFQYCCYADLLNYLRKNSDRYHKCVTDAFNKDCFRNLYHNQQSQKNYSEQKAPVELYVPMHSSTTRGQEDIALLNLPNVVEGYEDPNIVEIGDDQTDELQALTFDDLLSFAYQVAKGMDFLSSKNCVHRDLAARNVLVTKGRTVKIGDFGLARDIDNDSNYVVRGNVRLPVKWMAPESIFQGMYTLKSDVWAYGILLWEIFSLGVTPYPGMKVDHTFYSMIETGFKMECPYYATDAVYSAMCRCWALNPSDRPSFSKLVSFICDQLTDREEKLYHNMVDEVSSEYQNVSDISEISALEKQCENKTSTTNEYCKAIQIEKSKASNSEEEEEEEKEEEELLKPSDTK